MRTTQAVLPNHLGCLVEIIGCNRGHVHEVRHGRTHIHNLNRLGKTSEQRSHKVRATQFLQHFRGDGRRVNSGHDEHVGRFRQTAERIHGQRLTIERHIGGHFTVILKVDTALIQDLNSLPAFGRALTRRMSKGRIGEQSNAGLIAKTPRNFRRLDRNIGELFRFWHVVHICVANEHRTSAGDDHGETP